ncbi:unnamed protein product [Staurois parvus]|uniref:Uncharacterized protein n=1 Tax=Staurois parvus TaxID=386267 RepID=A0ABN9EAP5_9NEOB|nr:unnamed protein product [Staurois parvus]
MLTPSCPLPLAQCQCFFFSPDHCIRCHWGCQRHQVSSLPQCQNAHRSPATSC